MIHPIRAVLFDLDDTLYNRRTAFRRWALQFITLDLHISSVAQREAVCAWIEGLDANGYGSKYEMMRAVCARYPQVSGTVDEFYDAFVEQIVLETEANEVLTSLESHEIPFGIITNGSRRQYRKVARLGLDERTDCIFVSETFGQKKPHVTIFLAAAEKLGVPPAEILFVGDHPRNDIIGARAAGMQTAWLHRDQPWPESFVGQNADIVLSDLRELLSAIPIRTLNVASCGSIGCPNLEV